MHQFQRAAFNPDLLTHLNSIITSSTNTTHQVSGIFGPYSVLEGELVIKRSLLNKYSKSFRKECPSTGSIKVTGDWLWNTKRAMDEKLRNFVLSAELGLSLSQRTTQSASASISGFLPSDQCHVWAIYWPRGLCWYTLTVPAWPSHRRETELIICSM